ncbi:hypothetical protein INR49_025543, partial [Caranx melampygus]
MLSDDKKFRPMQMDGVFQGWRRFLESGKPRRKGIPTERGEHLHLRPSVAVDVRKTDSAGSSLYQPHHRSGGSPGSDPLGSLDNKQKQGFHNLGYSKSNDSTLKLEVDNNHVNHRLHAAPQPTKELHQQGSVSPAEGGLYIIQPEALGPRWGIQDKTPSQVPVYPSIQYENQRSYNKEEHHEMRNRWDSSITEYVTASENLSGDEIEVDEGVAGHRKVSTVESGISTSKSEDEEEQEARVDEEEVQSVTDSMVAEALAALEAATAGEE